MTNNTYLSDDWIEGTLCTLHLPPDHDEAVRLLNRIIIIVGYTLDHLRKADQ